MNKLKGNIVLWIVIVLVALSTAGGGYLYVKNKSILSEEKTDIGKSKTEPISQDNMKSPAQEKIPKMDHDIVRVKGRANRDPFQKDIYHLSLTTTAGDWIEGKEFKYIHEDCPDTSCTTILKTLELVSGGASLGIISEKVKLVEVEGLLKRTKFPVKDYPGGYRNAIVIVVDSITELEVKDLTRPALKGVAKFVEMALKSNNPQACKNAENKSPNSCLRELAITLQDSSICSFMAENVPNDPFTPDNCFEALAYIKFDRALCEKISVKDKSACDTLDITEKILCEQKTTREECLNNFSSYERALRSNNPSQCKAYTETYPPINEAIGHASCVAEYAWQTSSLSSCDKLYDGIMQVFYTKDQLQGLRGQEWCIYRNAVLKNDTSQCNQLIDPLAREICGQ